MVELLKRYWIQFDFTDSKSKLSWHSRMGYGVTACDKNDALSILAELVFENEPFPPIKTLIENVTMADLDQNHVVPNITVLPFKRGIWYPAGLEFIR